MSRFSTAIAYGAFLAALVMISLGVTGMVTAKGAQGPECKITVETVQETLAQQSAIYKVFSGEETKVLYAYLTEKFGPSPDGTPAALIVTLSPGQNRAVLLFFNEEGCLNDRGFSGSMDFIMPLIADALGKFAND